MESSLAFVGCGPVAWQSATKKHITSSIPRRSLTRMQQQIPSDNSSSSQELSSEERSRRTDALIRKAWNREQAAKKMQERIYAEAKFGPKEWKGTTLTRDRQVARDLTQYEQSRRQLLSDTMTLSAIGMAVAYAVDSSRSSISFGLGASASILYAVLLTKSVDRLARTARDMGENDSSSALADPSGGARLAIFAIVLVFVAKNREYFDFLPAVIGTLMHKLAVLIPAMVGDQVEDIYLEQPAIVDNESSSEYESD
mmetsp:Transcript_20344/g.35114  ORF Transcript_20344/g.35114 Transcript_20344/m.35114 type:complete len:255 (-) Transcript_20344:346-1110(-)|eukprot:CAMPEP_0184706320 /NCGR_PEP_ID=MMETSP0313-20130426/36701_1 /TAXON_ID=2792 /ORGANISM="Porphyridium aerugineum, Strain SAG 1380-2" /LENGTH=254 /DNA_ID=CAMNT_0027167871 /DNA_START=26 /DNA_END=790 /DNA_ORIENTATION=-